MGGCIFRHFLWHHVSPYEQGPYSYASAAIFRQTGFGGCERRHGWRSAVDLVSQHPDLRRHLYTDDGKLRAFVNIYVNDEDVRYLQKEATAIKESDNISIVPSIAGRPVKL